MNTNQLTKHYSTLTPDERLPLLIAARNRGDEIEENRLTVTAPPVLYRMGDHCKLHHTFHMLAWFHFMELVNLAGHYQHCLALADAFDDEDASSKRMIDAGNLYGYLFVANLEGWRSFTDRQGIEWDALFRDLPGFDTVKRTQGQYSMNPITKEAALKLFSKLRGDPVAGIITSELVANSFHEGFRSVMEE